MDETLGLAIAGEPVRLFADRALYWPARGRLLIADLHLGKGDTFRTAGIAVPTGGTAHDLGRLARLLARSGARSLWILGDFLHARRTAAVDAAWRDFRDAHRDVAVAVVPGIDVSGSAWVSVIVSALIVGLVNATLGFVFKVGAIGCIVMTLGVFSLVINALMLLLSSYIAENWLNIGFHVDGFWPAFWGAIVISIVSGVLSWFVRDEDEE